MLGKRITAILLSTGMAVVSMFGSVTPAAAACTDAKITVYEDIGQGGDAKTFCFGGNVSDLRNIAHGQSGICAADWKFDDNWNDCISSFVYDEGALNTSVCLYENPNYGGNAVKLSAEGAGSFYSWHPLHDRISSVKFGNNCL